MMEVLKALQELNVCWKKIGSYNVKCRSTPYYHESTISTNNDPIKSPHVVKFEVQVTNTSRVPDFVFAIIILLKKYLQSNACFDAS